MIRHTLIWYASNIVPEVFSRADEDHEGNEYRNCELVVQLEREVLDARLVEVEP